MSIILSSVDVNVARHLSTRAQDLPDSIAVAAPRGWYRNRRRVYRTISFAQLDDESTRLAAGLQALGVKPGVRLALLVPPGIEFVSLVFALLKSGAVAILIDPGMGRASVLRCLAEVEPRGFVAVPIVHVARRVLARKFPLATLNVVVGRRFFGNAITLAELRALGDPSFKPIATQAEDPAAIIFTTGSTGPAKGVLYSHGNFDHQVRELREFYDLQPGGIDLACFPLFGLFNAALGITTVIPVMDPSRPAKVDPRRIAEAVTDWSITQSFASPAVWNRIGQHCEKRHVRLPTLTKVFSAGAPVSAQVLAKLKACMELHGEIHTPYGATEALPVASISASEVLGETSHRTQLGAGVCVGHRFPGIQWKIIEIHDGPIRELSAAVEMPTGQIGELVVVGPQVTREYVTRREANALAKIRDNGQLWHRMGDVGYLDAEDRFWFCGRMAQRVLATSGPMYTVCCEAIFNNHPSIYRSALVGIGQSGKQRPVIVAEPWPEHRPRRARDLDKLTQELRQLALGNSLTRDIQDFLLCRAMPVDIRHNAKIFREKLAAWAEIKLGGRAGTAVEGSA